MELRGRESAMKTGQIELKLLIQNFLVAYGPVSVSAFIYS